MTISNTDLFIIRDVLELKRKAGRLQITTEHRVYRANDYTLLILDQFKSPNSLKDALIALQPFTKSMKQSMYLSSQILGLIQAEILVPLITEDIVVPHFSDGDFSGAEIHIRMLNDSARTLFYQRIISRSISSMDTVLEVGTGTGILTAFLAKSGCKHVYSIEKNENFARIAKQLLRTNNLEKKVTIIIGDSKKVKLPEKADKLVSEIIGHDPFDEGLIDTVNDARRRLLKPSATVLPERLKIYLIGCEADKHLLSKYQFTHEKTKQWQKDYGINFSSLVDKIDNKTYRKLIKSEQLSNLGYLTEAKLTVEMNMNETMLTPVQSEIELVINKAGTLNSVLLYFEIESQGDVLSLHPMSVNKTSNWGHYIWVFGQAKCVSLGDRVRLIYKYDDVIHQSKLEVSFD